MIELSALAFLFRLMNLGCEPVIATRVVAADHRTLRRVLSDPASYDGEARVRPSSSARVVAVRVRFGRRRIVRYTWILSPGRGATEVDLAAQVESCGIVVRLALLLGGRRWLRRRLDAILATVASVAADGARPIEVAEIRRSAASDPTRSTAGAAASPRT
ncbi:MAG: hypothetical protein QOD24_2858 [Solirubrobacteraceae bacterium]|jgi:hypothetical protein|nr:hypothetical protein [Solirubrobacteraceae bacterium]